MGHSQDEQIDISSEIPLVCVPDAIPEGQWGSHRALAERLMQSPQAINEQNDGYQFLYPVEMLPDVAQYVSLERLCCPFLTFTIQVVPSSESVSLTISGREGVKDFFREELGLGG